MGNEKKNGSGGIRTHASEETGALNQRLRPLGHATLVYRQEGEKLCIKMFVRSGIWTHASEETGALTH